MPEPLLTVWDLDETVGHALRIPDGYGWRDEILIRPGLAEAIEASLLLGPNMVWTAASEGHAARMIQAVRDVTGHAWPLRDVWTRERCTLGYDPDTGEYGLLNLTRLKSRDSHFADRLAPLHVKRLSKLRRRHDRRRLVAVDDRAANFGCAYGNHVPVPAYTGEADDVMFRLARFLPALAGRGDVRCVEKRGWFTAPER